MIKSKCCKFPMEMIKGVKYCVLCGLKDQNNYLTSKDLDRATVDFSRRF